MGSGPWGFKSPLAHYVYPHFNRRRRRRAFVALLVVSILAAILIAAGSLRSETRLLVAYFDQARIAAAEHAELAADFRQQIIEGIGDLDRNRLMTLMAQMVETSDRMAAEVEGTEVPAAAARPAASLTLALASWKDGLGAFEEQLLAVVDDPGSLVAIGDLASVLVDLEVGDRAYERFVAEVEAVRDEADVEIGRFPAVGYLSAALAPLTYAERLSDRAAGAEGLALRRDLAIAAVRLEPEETGGEAGGVPILPFTETVLVQVVVANDGNRDETDLTVSLVLEGGAGNLLLERSEEIVDLAAGLSSTVEFADIPVAPGETHTVIISVSAVVAEADTENNLRQRPFFVNEPA